MKISSQSHEAEFCTYLTAQHFLFCQVLYTSFGQLSSHLFWDKCRFQSCILMGYSWFLFEPPDLRTLSSHCFNHKNLFPRNSTDWVEDGNSEIMFSSLWTVKKQHTNVDHRQDIVLHKNSLERAGSRPALLSLPLIAICIWSSLHLI